MKSILSFDWLLSTKKINPLILLFLFQPIYIIWLFKVTRLCEKATHKPKNKLFFATTIWVLTSIFILILFTEKIVDINIFKSYKNIITTMLMWSVLVSWLYCIYYATLKTIELDEILNVNFYPQIGHRILRFFILLYWPFGIFILQNRINESYFNLFNTPN